MITINNQGDMASIMIWLGAVADLIDDVNGEDKFDSLKDISTILDSDVPDNIHQDAEALRTEIKNDDFFDAKKDIKDVESCGMDYAEQFAEAQKKYKARQA